MKACLMKSIGCKEMKKSSKTQNSFAGNNILEPQLQRLLRVALIQPLCDRVTPKFDHQDKTKIVRNS